MHDDLLVTDLVARAGNGEKQAWDALVERYSPLIWSICRRHRLGDADARAAGHSVWRQLCASPGWSPRSRRACWLAGWRSPPGGNAEMCGPRRRDCRLPGNSPALGGNPSIRLVRPNRSGLRRNVTRLREAFSRLPPCCQRLLTLLIDEPSMPDTEISARLGIPVGSIGPARGRCLDNLRRDPAVAALTSAGTAPREMPGRALAQ
jgi:hypothetical protein